MKVRLLSEIPTWVFYGILFLALFLHKNLHVSTAWRYGVLLLSIIFSLDLIVRSKTLWLQTNNNVRQLVILWILFVVMMIFTASHGYTHQLNDTWPFLNDFILHFGIPFLLISYISQWKHFRIIFIGLFAGIVLFPIGNNLLQYAKEFYSDGLSNQSWREHRGYSNGLEFGLPILLWMSYMARDRFWKIACWLLVGIGCILLVLTGARGAWLAGFSTLLLFAFFAGGKYFYISIIGTIIVLAIALSSVVPYSVAVSRVQQGFDTSNRTTGTWGPTLDMIKKRPWFGYGYGPEVYHAIYQRNKPQHENWFFNKSLGPHNLFLSIAFFAGIPSALIFILILTGVSYHLLRYLVRMRHDSCCRYEPFYLSALTLISIIVGHVVIRGMVEDRSWPSIIFVMSLALVWINIKSSHTKSDQITTQ